MNVFVFDVDGTLTPSRLRIDPNFEAFFLSWMSNKPVILVTGSDKEKTIEQVGEKIWNSSTACLQSCGNHIFINGEEVYRNPWTPSPELISFLEMKLTESSYETRTSTHIEKRIGLLNFSIVGRDCTQAQREDYFDWDSVVGERIKIAREIMEKFPDLEASVGGQISIDIHPLGANKSQTKEWILKNIGKDSKIHFFGDRMEEGGNDHDLQQVLDFPHQCFPVTNWKDTMHLLCQL